jgi:hypothetical protein
MAVPHIVRLPLFVLALQNSEGIYARQDVSLRETSYVCPKVTLTAMSIVIANLIQGVSITKKKTRCG